MSGDRLRIWFPLVLLIFATPFLADFLTPIRVRVPIGAFDRDLLDGPWSQTLRADIDPPASTDTIHHFYYRLLRSGSQLAIPLRSSGAVDVEFRSRATVRSQVTLVVNGSRQAEKLITTGPWNRYRWTLAAGTAARPLRMSLALRPVPLVAGVHLKHPEIQVDDVFLEARAGWHWDIPTRILLLLSVFLILGFGWVLGWRGIPLLLGGVFGAGVLLALLHWQPFSVVAALPRLLPLAFVLGTSTYLIARKFQLATVARNLAVLIAVGFLFHAALSFAPDHAPPDLEIHVRRTRDIALVPFEYGAWMRYGSQLPTPSQTFGQATAALGEKVLIPYSPLPYCVYYALQQAGVDLRWGMGAINAFLAMGAAILIFWASLRVWGLPAAWVATLLYVLDLAVWHHFGRSHAPATFGNALGIGALLFLLGHSMDPPWKKACSVAAVLLLVLGWIGYSSALVLVGLFAFVLLILLIVDAQGMTRSVRSDIGRALVLSGLAAGVLFYFHYVPGLLQGAVGVEAETDIFPGKTFFIFHNESRQNMRLWSLGLWIPFVVGAILAPVALRRAHRAARPILVAWLVAWAIVMLLKEPLLFPRLLRWAKEDQFVSPLICLCVGGGLSVLPRSAFRFVAVLVVLGALALQLRDYAHHANSLLL